MVSSPKRGPVSLEIADRGLERRDLGIDERTQALLEGAPSLTDVANGGLELVDRRGRTECAQRVHGPSRGEDDRDGGMSRIGIVQDVVR
jgi:hypothetical protein